MLITDTALMTEIQKILVSGDEILATDAVYVIDSLLSVIEFNFE